MADRAARELEEIERHIIQTIAQIAEARRSLSQGGVPDLSAVREPLRKIEDWFACHDKPTRAQLAGPLIGLHEEIEGMVADLAAGKQAVERDLNSAAHHKRAHHAYARDAAATPGRNTGVRPTVEGDS